MQHAHAPADRLAPIAIETPNFLIRFLRPEDATDRWPVWFDAPDVREALNLPALSRSKDDMAAYIRGFDQHMSLALGAFDKKNGLLVCIGSAYIDWARREYIINTMVGEAAYRNAGVMTELTAPFRDYFFDVLELNAAIATALSTNTVIRTYLEKTGWTLIETLKNHTRRHSDGAMIDLCRYRLTREAWRGWKAARLEAAKK